jgi:hypothetical protein
MAQALRDLLPQLALALFRTELPPDLPARLALCDRRQLQAAQAALTTEKSLGAWLAQLPKVSGD